MIVRKREKGTFHFQYRLNFPTMDIRLLTDCGCQQLNQNTNTIPSFSGIRFGISSCLIKLKFHSTNFLYQHVRILLGLLDLIFQSKY